MSTAMISAASSTCSVAAQRSNLIQADVDFVGRVLACRILPVRVFAICYSQQALTIYSIIIVTPPIFLFLFVDKNESGRDVLSLSSSSPMSISSVQACLTTFRFGLNDARDPGASVPKNFILAQARSLAWQRLELPQTMIISERKVEIRVCPPIR
jgi:hypothetical protein